MKQEKLFKKMNIQFFADPGTGEGGASGTGEGSGGGANPETVSKADYDKLLKQFEAQKNRIDELSKNEKEYKKQIADKQTDEEKKAQQEQEIRDKLADYESKFENMSIEKELISGGFTNEEAEQIIKVKDNKVDLAKKIVDIFKTKLDSSKKLWEQELANNTKGVSGSGGSGKETIDSNVDAYLKGKSDITQNARDYYLKNKK